MLKLIVQTSEDWIQINWQSNLSWLFILVNSSRPVIIGWLIPFLLILQISVDFRQIASDCHLKKKSQSDSTTPLPTWSFSLIMWSLYDIVPLVSWAHLETTCFSCWVSFIIKDFPLLWFSYVNPYYGIPYLTQAYDYDKNKTSWLKWIVALEVLNNGHVPLD